MKKISILLATAILLPATAFAAPQKNASYRYHYGMAGCGLGSMLVDTPDRYDDKVFQVVAGVVNSVLGSQLFGITSGTSNCYYSPFDVSRMEQQVYLNSNFAELEKEAAKGEGEHLVAFADVLGCAPESATFATLSQQRHSTLFSDAKPDAVLNRYITAIQAHPTLAKSCSRAR